MILKKCSLGNIVHVFDPHHYGSGKQGKFSCLRKIYDNQIRLKPLEPEKYDRPRWQRLRDFFFKAQG
ncbi:MAG: hypothetical protein WC861_05700 [Candidatus Micrarchaeia archaeon]